MDVRKFEYIIDILKELRELSLDSPIMVEGKRDEKALRDMGIMGKILKVQTSSSVLELCESVARDYKSVILFTDIDSAGKRIGRLVKKYLTDKGVKVNDNIAKKLMSALETAEAENVSKRLEKAFRKFNYP
jgi:5S rRNA maturation endonuclease (ribonuclease M5)